MERLADLYFCYGSNLKLSRMRERVPGARPRGCARLSGYRVVCDKRGADGTGKANLRPDRRAVVWGAVYTLETSSFADLDAFEPGYERRLVEVAWADTRSAGAGPDASANASAWTYVSSLTTPHPVPAPWYKQLVVEGAREHALPPEWILELEAWPVLEP